MARLPRRMRFPIGRSPDRSGITGETISGPSGREWRTTPTGHRVANPWQTVRNRHQAMCVTPMTFPGIGHIDIRRLSHLPIDPMCRAAPRRP